MTRSLRLVLLLLGTLVVGCLTQKRPPAPGTTLQCPNGASRVVMECGNVEELKARVLSANAGLQKFGLGFSAQFDERALEQVTSSTHDLALQLDAACKNHNACVDAEQLTAGVSLLRQHLSLSEQATQAPSEDAGDKVWRNAVPAAAARRLEMKLKVETRSSEREPFAVHDSGAPVSSGSELRFTVETNLPAHAYILLLSSQGEATALYPRAGVGIGNPLPVGSSQIPAPQAGVFALDDVQGDEHLQIVLSEHPLTDLQQRLDAMKSAQGTRSDAVLPAIGALLCEPKREAARGIVLKPTSVECAGSTKRGIVHKQASVGAAEVVSTEPNDHVIVLQHAIQHVARP